MRLRRLIAPPVLLPAGVYLELAAVRVLVPRQPGVIVEFRFEDVRVARPMARFVVDHEWNRWLNITNVGLRELSEIWNSL